MITDKFVSPEKFHWLTPMFAGYAKQVSEVSFFSFILFCTLFLSCYKWTGGVQWLENRHHVLSQSVKKWLLAHYTRISRKWTFLWDWPWKLVEMTSASESSSQFTTPRHKMHYETDVFLIVNYTFSMKVETEVTNENISILNKRILNADATCWWTPW